MRPGTFLVQSAVLLALTAVSALGCSPKIGDSCQLHSDCSQTGDRICDPTMPGGYCTQFNCEPGSCPGEAVCVGFYAEPASVPECRNPAERRLERTFCMKNCESDGDCRTNYHCLDFGYSEDPDNPVSAVVLEGGGSNKRVCTTALPTAKATRSGEVCDPGPLPDGSFGPMPRWQPSASDSGAARDASTPSDAGARDGGQREGGP